jgi:hypothetical protein
MIVAEVLMSSSTGAIWWAAMKIYAEVGDLEQRTGDDQV